MRDDGNREAPAARLQWTVIGELAFAVVLGVCLLNLLR
jgi:hypothetical protein